MLDLALDLLKRLPRFDPAKAQRETFIARIIKNHAATIVEERKAGIKDGTFSVWKGPIVDQAGKVMLAKDQVADDKWMHDVKWYVKGVQGSVPK